MADNTGIIDNALKPGDLGYVDPAVKNATASNPAISTSNLGTSSISDQLDSILGNQSLMSPASPSPASWNVDQNQTVEGRVKGIIDSNSPLMQQAKATANESANSRGLINSAMATQAGQSALYSAALPIASQDANTFAAAGQFNAAEANKMNMQLIDDQNKVQLANINTSYQGLVAANQGASQLYDTYQRAINAILTSADMNAETKQSAINMQLEMMQAGMAMYSGINDLNISGLLDFSTTASTLEPIPEPSNPITKYSISAKKYLKP